MPCQQFQLAITLMEAQFNAFIHSYSLSLIKSYKIMMQVKGSRMGRSDKVSLWYVALLINTRFRFFYFRISNC